MELLKKTEEVDKVGTTDSSHHKLERFSFSVPGYQESAKHYEKKPQRCCIYRVFGADQQSGNETVAKSEGYYFMMVVTKSMSSSIAQPRTNVSV